MNNWSIIILGATGDLSRKKLIPSLYYLLEHQKQNLNLIFIGAAKDDIDIDQLLHEVHLNMKNLNHTAWTKFKQNAYYFKINFENLDDFKKLETKINLLEKIFEGNVNRIAYLAAPADFYCVATQNLVDSGIIKKQSYSNANCDRIVYEKPFGWDLKSAQEIDDCISALLNENQIYRIDHYLTKALVNSILSIRFSNIIFEPLWNSEFIDHIQIIFSETVSIEGRAQFYDRYGALKDVVQNHMLQILSLLAMEKPQAFEIDQINHAKSEVLKKISIVDGLVGQYEGYLKEKDVKKDSKAETFVVLKCILQNKRWSNVPFYLKTGKCLNAKSTEIHVVFKKVDENANILTIRVSPNAELSITLNVKTIDDKIMPINMDFCYRCYFGYDLPRPYEILLSEVISGDKSVSISWDQIKYSWMLIDKIEKLLLPLYQYKVGSSGPKESSLFAKKYNFEWFL